MSVQLSMFDLPIFADMCNAISSPGSAAGPMPCGLPVGLKIDRSGRDHARASPSAKPGSSAARPTSATCGPSGSVLLRSAALQHALANRLRRQLDTVGSTVYLQTWKEKATPAGRLLLAHTARERPTNGKGCTSWPTPNTMDTLPPRDMETFMEYNNNRDGRHNRLAVSNLRQAVAMHVASWPTPNTKDATIGATISDGYALTLARLAAWATPQVADINNSRYADNQEKSMKHLAGLNHSADLAHQTQALAPWRTPTVCSPNSQRGTGQDPEKRKAQGHTVNLQDQIRLVSGPMPNGSLAATASIGQLNQEHSRWLMGYPEAWGQCQRNYKHWQAWQGLMAQA